jgi:ribosomal protein S18 acetylase RimI-like enzyme
MIIENGDEYIAEVRELIIEYTNRLNRNLSFQGLDDELNSLEDKYFPPNGELIVALEDENVLGMVAYHRHDNNTCEMKRLYIKPEARGKHLGDILVSEIIKRAQNNGFKEMVLDTIAPLKPAISLYKKHGFIECKPYYNNPMDDVIYMKKEL